MTRRNFLKIVELNSIQEVDSQQWDDLWAHCPNATVFQTRLWAQAWMRAFRDTIDSVKLVVAIEDRQLIGLAPLVVLKSDGTKRSEWVVLGDDYSDYQLFLTRRNSQKVMAALLEGIDRCLPFGATVVFRDVPQFSAMWLQLEDRASRKGGVKSVSSAIACPTLRVRGNHSGVSRVLGKNSIRRSERALRRLGAIELEHRQNAAEIEPLLPGLFHQHVARWAPTGHPSLFLKTENRKFYHELVHELAPAGHLVYTTLRLNGEIIAQHFGLRSRDSLLWYKPAFDPRHGKLSPGETMIKSLVQYVGQEGLAELDFTRGDESFKSRFASVVRYNHNFIWSRARIPRLSIQLRGGLNTFKRRVFKPDPVEPSALGGVPWRPAPSGKVLVLDGEKEVSIEAGKALSRQGLEVHMASATHECRAAGHVVSLAQPVASDVGAFKRWISELDSKHGYELIVPGTRESVLAISTYPETHHLRWKSLTPPVEASQPGRGLLDLYGRQATGAAAVNDELSRRAWTVTCLYAYGVMLWCRVEKEACNAESAGQHTTGSGELVQHVKNMLDRCQWHGVATVILVADVTGGVIIQEIVPCIRGVRGVDIHRKFNFAVALWKISRGLRLDAQPKGFIF